MGFQSVGTFVFDRNYVAFPALLDSCHPCSLVGFPIFTVRFERYLVAHADP